MLSLSLSFPSQRLLLLLLLLLSLLADWLTTLARFPSHHPHLLARSLYRRALKTQTFTHTAATRSRPDAHDAVLAALTDVVTISPSPQSHARSGSQHTTHTTYSGAAPMAHSEPPPALPSKDPYENPVKPPPKPAKTGMGAKFSNAFRKETREDKEARRKEKEARMNKEISKGAARSTRMDIIDRLDLSGIHGSSSECSETCSVAVFLR